QPFLLGPIFKAQGWDTSPFNVYPAKGRYMVRDVGRVATARGLPFAMPDAFPAHSLSAARLITAIDEPAERARLAGAIFRAEFDGRGVDISSRDELGRVLEEVGLDPAVIARIDDGAVKQALRSATDEAGSLGIFGAPTFVTEDGELFWGDDRLEMALAHAASLARTSSALS
ncbi:MAG: 2-hydroxychromene-2-carboxylate isomerase, partial [Pseudomonadota bacterium]